MNKQTINLVTITTISLQKSLTEWALWAMFVCETFAWQLFSFKGYWQLGRIGLSWVHKTRFQGVKTGKGWFEPNWAYTLIDCFTDHDFHCNYISQSIASVVIEFALKCWVCELSLFPFGMLTKQMDCLSSTRSIAEDVILPQIPKHS